MLLVSLAASAHSAEYTPRNYRAGHGASARLVRIKAVIADLIDEMVDVFGGRAVAVLAPSVTAGHGRIPDHKT